MTRSTTDHRRCRRDRMAGRLRDRAGLQAPPVAEPSTFRGQATAEAASLADLPWWEVFEDPA